MRLLFAGTPEVAVPSLRALHAAGHEIALVLTREDALIGRRRVLTASPVAQAAAELGLPLLKRNRLTAEAEPDLAAAEAQLGVVVAYGGLIREPLLSLPEHGWINAHFSLLPAWRGAAPVQRALIAGDAESGVSVFRLVEALDAGPVYERVPYPIGAMETAGALLSRLSLAAGPILERVVEGIADGSAVAVAQQGEVTTAPKLGIEDALLDPAAGSAALLARWRGVTPEPGAWLELDGERLKVLEAAAASAPGEAAAAPGTGRVALLGGRLLLGTADGAVALLRVQPAGRAAMPAADWWRGRR